MGVLPVSDPQSALPPAGWYPDPSGAPQQRWWDGQGWTVHYQGAATAPVTPVAIVAPASAPVQVPVNAAVYQPAVPVQTAPSARVQPQVQFQPVQAAATLANAPGPSFATAASRTGVDEVIAPTGARALEASSMFPLVTTPVSAAVPTTSPVATAAAVAPASALPTAGFDFSFGGATGAPAAPAGTGPGSTTAPFGITDFAGLGQTSSASVLSYETAPTTWSTRSGWLLALLPLVQLAITGAMFYLWVNVGLAPIAVMLLSALPALLALAAVISDQRKLRELGFDRPPSWAWIFIGAWLYLILRAVATRREMGAGSALIWVWLASSIIASAAGTAAVLYFSALYAA
jgi:hypothetical protein